MPWKKWKWRAIKKIFFKQKATIEKIIKKTIKKDL